MASSKKTFRVSGFKFRVKGNGKSGSAGGTEDDSPGWSCVAEPGVSDENTKTLSFRSGPPRGISGDAHVVIAASGALHRQTRAWVKEPFECIHVETIAGDPSRKSSAQDDSVWVMVGPKWE